MENVTFYWLPHCSTCIKAKAFLEAEGVSIATFRDIKTERLSLEEVTKLAAMAGGAENIFSRRAIKYREMGLNQREVGTEEMLELMSTEYTFIKRPVLVAGEVATAGFSEKNFRELLAR